MHLDKRKSYLNKKAAIANLKSADKIPVSTHKGVGLIQKLIIAQTTVRRVTFQVLTITGELDTMKKRKKINLIFAKLQFFEKFSQTTRKRSCTSKTQEKWQAGGLKCEKLQNKTILLLTWQC